MKSIQLTPVSRIFHPKGDILHGIKNSDETFTEFGEAYFSFILKGEIKGWKRHNKMTMNILVPQGNVRFYIHNELEKVTQRFEIGIKNYSRLTIPPGYWLAFKGIDNTPNLILNVASIPHEPSEADNLPLNTFTLKI